MCDGVCTPVKFHLSLAALAKGSPNEIENGVGNGSRRFASHLITIVPMNGGTRRLMLRPADCGEAGVGAGNVDFFGPTRHADCANEFAVNYDRQSSAKHNNSRSCG